MAEIELMQLPDHILAQILKHIPGHFTTSLVCKKFYELDCSNHKENSNLLLKLDTINDETLDSILSSQRALSEMQVDVTGHKIKILKKIFRHHGASVKELLLYESCSERKFQLSEKKLVKLLNFFPNLESLDIRCNEIKISVEDGSRVVQLPKLKTISIHPNTLGFFAKFLPDRVNDVRFDFVDYEIPEESIATMFEKVMLMKIEKLTIKDDLEEPQLQWPTLKLLLASQKDQLKFLSLKNIDNAFENELFLELLNFNQLESLGMNRINSASVEKFSKLTTLKRLELCMLSQELSLITSVPVVQLTLNLVQRHVLEELGKNYPIKSLKVCYSRKSQTGLRFYLQNFPRLEKLDLNYEDENLYSNASGVFLRDRIHYLHLKSLKLEFGLEHHFSDTFFEMLIAFPNLTELFMCGGMIISDDFSINLNKFIGKIKTLSLKTLVIHSPEFFNDESIQSLQQLSKALQNANLTIATCTAEPLIERSKESLDRLIGYYRIALFEDSEKSFTLKKNSC